MPAKVEKPSTLKESEKDLAVWTAPARPFKRQDRQFFVTLIAIASILGLVLFLVEGVMPVVLIISLIFLYYIMSTVPPDNIEYKLTNRGVKVAENLTEWGNFTRYWFSRRFDSELLVFETIAIPGRMELVITPEVKSQITKALIPYVVFEEVPPSYIDKAASWFSKKLPQG
jgi:hypothetical protein